MSDWVVVFGKVAGHANQADETPQQAILRRSIRETRKDAANKARGEPDHEEKLREYYGNLTHRDINDIKDRFYAEIYGTLCGCGCVVVLTITCIFIVIMANSVIPADKMARLLPAQCTLNNALSPYIGTCVGGPQGTQDCMVVTLNFTVMQYEKSRIALFDETWTALSDVLTIAQHFNTVFIPGTVYKCFTDGVDLEIYIPGVESKGEPQPYLEILH